MRSSIIALWCASYEIRVRRVTVVLGLGLLFACDDGLRADIDFGITESFCIGMIDMGLCNQELV